MSNDISSTANALASRFWIDILRNANAMNVDLDEFARAVAHAIIAQVPRTLR